MHSPYDATARNYNELHGDEQRKKLAVIAQYVPKEAKILDVGCGTGISGEFFEDVTGLDPSAELLKQATIPVVQGAAEALPFADKSFDAVICVTAFHHFDYEKALLEMKRVSKGMIAISLLKKSRDFALQESAIRAHLRMGEKFDLGVDTLFLCNL